MQKEIVIINIGMSICGMMRHLTVEQLLTTTNITLGYTNIYQQTVM